MGDVACPVGVRIVRRQKPYPSAWFRYTIELGDKRGHVGHVLDDVVADDFVKFAVSEGIGDVSEVMDDVGVRVGNCGPLPIAPGCLLRPHPTSRILFPAAAVTADTSRDLPTDGPSIRITAKERKSLRDLRYGFARRDNLRCAF